MSLSFIRRVIGLPLALILAFVLTACGGGDSGGDIDVYPPVKLTRHQQFSKNSAANSPKLRSNVVVKGGLQTSQTNQNGRVVDVFPVWTKDAAGEHHEAVYVLYSFLADDVINTGTVSPTSAVNTELWRYANNAWCPIIAGSLGFSTSVAQLLRPAGQVSFDRATPIRLMVGTADGVVGQIAFVDPEPTSPLCKPVQAPPGTTSLYTVMHETGMRGGITNMKLVDVAPAFLPTVAANPLADVKGVYIWGGSVCAASGIDASGNCTARTSQIPMAGLMNARTGQWLNGPDAPMMPLVLDTVPGPRADPNSAASEAQSLDVQLVASSDYSSVTTNVVISYVQGPQQVVFFRARKPVYQSDGVWFDPWVGDGTAMDVPVGGASGGAVNWLPPQSGYGTAFLFTPNKYGDYAGGQVCKVSNFAQPATCAWAMAPDGFSFPTGGSPTFGAPVPFEIAAVDWSAAQLDPKEITDFSLMSVNPLVIQNQPTMFWMDSAQTQTGTGFAVARVSPNFYSTTADQSVLVLSEARALVAPSVDRKSLRTFLVSATTDTSTTSQQSTTVITSGQLLKGGISLCVVTAQTNSNPGDFSACVEPRAPPQDQAVAPFVAGEASDGSIYGDATIVSGDNTFMAAPTLIRFSVAPDASEVKVYSVTRAGRISVALANTAAAQWNSLTNGWSAISYGRSATCATALNKPALPDPPPQAPPATPPTPPKHWWQKAVAHAFAKSFITGTLAMASDYIAEAAGDVFLGPEAGPLVGMAAGFVVDLAVGTLTDVADGKGKAAAAAAPNPEDAQTVYNEWMAVFDQVSLSQSCQLN